MDDFVFLDTRNRPFRVKKWSDGLWLFYWHRANNNWVSLRPIRDDEIKGMEARKLTNEQAALYNDYHVRQGGES